MDISIALEDLINIIEFVVVVVSLIVNIIIFWLLRKRYLKREMLVSDIINIGLERFKNFIDIEKKENQSKQKNRQPLDVSPQIEKINKKKQWQNLEKFTGNLRVKEFVSDDKFDKRGVGEKESKVFYHLEKARDIMKEIDL